MNHVKSWGEEKSICIKETVFTILLIYFINIYLAPTRCCDGYWGDSLRESKKERWVISIAITTAILWVNTVELPAGRYGRGGWGKGTLDALTGKALQRKWPWAFKMSRFLPSTWGRGWEKPAQAEGSCSLNRCTQAWNSPFWGQGGGVGDKKARRDKRERKAQSEPGEL